MNANDVCTTLRISLKGIDLGPSFGCSQKANIMKNGAASPEVLCLEKALHKYGRTQSCIFKPLKKCHINQ